MACGASFFESDPIKDKQREEKRLKQNKEASEKIASFFSGRLGSNAVTITPRSHTMDHKCDKMFLTKGADALTIQHRGYEISVKCDPVDVVPEFEKWRRVEMTHARITSKDH